VGRLIAESRGNQGDLVVLAEFLGQLLVEHSTAAPERGIFIVEH
jgi:hypothetical protein